MSWNIFKNLKINVRFIFGNSVNESFTALLNPFNYRLTLAHIVSWRFTILLLGEIGRQLVKAPLSVHI